MTSNRSPQQLGDTLHAATIQAYLESDYRVDAQPAFVLRVGQASPELLAAHSGFGVDCSAFVTACNPYSQPLSPAANAARQAALSSEIAAMGLPFIQGTGRHPSNTWPGEDSLLILGLTLAATKLLGTRHEQNAVIWIGADAVPQLVLLR